MVDMEKILVTGGAGFIGSHLVGRLLAMGHDVTVVDDLSTGQFKHIEPHQQNSKFHFIEQDVVKPIDLEVTQIYHLACPASPKHYQQDPVKTTKTCVLGALNVLDLAKRNGCRILNASTSEVYGDPLVHPQVESDWGNVNPVGIRSCYDEGKRCAETLFMDYHRNFGVDVVIARIFNTYGPNMDSEDGRVIPNFINQALLHKPITIYGDGSQTRSFCYVDDLVTGLIDLMQLSSQHTGPYNIGNPGEFTMIELAEKVKTLTQSSSEVCFKPLPKDDPVRRKPNIDAIHKAISFEPKVKLNEGLEATIAYFKAKLPQTCND